MKIGKIAIFDLKIKATPIEEKR